MLTITPKSWLWVRDTVKFSVDTYSCSTWIYLIHLIKQESPPAGNRKRRTTRGITCPRIYYPRGRGYLPWRGRGYLLWMGKGYLPWTGRRGYLPWLGEEVPTLARGGGTYLGPGEGYLPWGTQPPVDRQTDVSKHYLPVVLRTRAVMNLMQNRKKTNVGFGT